MPKKFSSGESPKAKNRAARMAAAQAVYQALHNQQSPSQVYEEFLMHRRVVEVDGQAKPLQPDGALMKKIVMGVEERHVDLEAMLKANTKENKTIELLLKAILLCGAYELLAGGVDAPIIINDYLNVTHSFYESGEVSLVNGVLDSIAKSMR